MNDRELKIWAYERAIEQIKKADHLPYNRAKLIQRYNTMIADEKFLLEREKTREKVK